MTNPALTDLERALSPAVRRAAQNFATALSETPEYKKFEEMAQTFLHDQGAQQTIAAFKARQQALKAMIMLNAVSDAERAELERLRQAVLANPTYAAYRQAQDDLIALCRAADGLLTSSIGLSLSAACSTGCC